jgi:methylenetetrahydrofolate reductase (NADPH)
MPKITDLLDAHAGPGPPFAFEFYPPRTQDGVEKLYERLERMAKSKPLYVDFTWGAGGSTSDLTLELAVQAKKRFGLEPNMHLTCTNMEASKVDAALDACREAGIRNIVALRGDPPKGQEAWAATDGGFACARDLVKHIRAKHADYFCISVAGYPEGHPTVIKPVEDAQALSPTERARLVRLPETDPETGAERVEMHVCRDVDFAGELAYLKSKVDAGADMIITQMFFDADVFHAFVAQCRAAGVPRAVRIVPGIMLLQAYGGFTRMTKFCKSCVPADLRAALEKVRHDSKAVKSLGAEHGVRLSRALMTPPPGGEPAPVLHYYTLNLEKVVNQVLRELGLGPASSVPVVAPPDGAAAVVDDAGCTRPRSQAGAAAPNRLAQMSVHLRAPGGLGETAENFRVGMTKGTVLSESFEDGPRRGSTSAGTRPPPPPSAE